MKRILLLFLLIANIGNAQNIFFPDPNFKAVLVGIQASVDASNAYDINNNTLTLDANSDGEIQVSEALLVYKLTFELQTTVTDITGIENFTNLTMVDCKGCSISTLDFSVIPSLININCSANPLTAINLTGLNLLQTISCDNTTLTSIDLSQLPALTSASCINNSSLTSIDVTNSSNITQLLCSNNQLTNLDVSSLKNLQTINCSGNQLVGLNLKNGAQETVDLTNNPGLTYVCQDKNQSDALQATIPTVSVNAYCSVPPGGNYDTYMGTYKFDSDNNGCTQSDLYILKYQKLAVLNDGEYAATFTNDFNNYIYYSDTGGTVIRTVSLEDFSAFLINEPPPIITLTDDFNLVVNQDYCITSNGIHPDVEVVISPLINALPNSDTQYEIIYRNKGNQILSGDIQLNFNDNTIDFISSTLVPTSVATGNLNWTYTNLLPFETKRIELVFNVNSPVDISPVNVGDSLTYQVSISPSAGDDSPLDNQFTFHHIVAASLVPNQVICLEGDSIPQSIIGNYIHYAISFENTDTATVTNVVVKETFDTNKYDITSLQILHNSDTMYTEVTNNIVEHYFENTELEDHNHGNIILKIRIPDTLTVVDTVLISAEIYFNYLLPVPTNMAKTTFYALTDGINEYPKDESLNVYPNPGNGTFTVTTENNLKTIEVFDAQGRLVYTKIGTFLSPVIDLTGKQSGLYYLKVITDKGAAILKIEKE